MNGEHGSLISTEGRVPSISCPRCDCYLIGRWSPWCSKAMSPLLFVKVCPMEEDGE